MKTALVLAFCLVALVASAVGTPASCRPGTTFKDDCNTCICTSSGLAACTLIACNSAGQQLRVARAVQECVPGSTFKRECNDCFCTDQGMAACTRSACV